ncbi:MAG: alpha/beta hydrolase family protein [Gemmataceae bacterium]
MRLGISCAVLLALALGGLSAEPDDVKALLARDILAPQHTLTETQDYCLARVPRMDRYASVSAWDKHADKMRADILKHVVFRGAAKGWRDAKCKVEYLDNVKAGEGYRLKKLRYEALPGLWIPALLYEPEKLEGKVPVYMAVNGHDRGNGKAAGYKQIRCINLAKRGVITLNVEWLGMGQLNTDGFGHYRMNQLDLCGTSGLAPFYLSMSRGIDLLLAHPNADPERVAVSGLSGGGWQTIFISALDPRVKLCNPVAGYSSFIARGRHFKDLGDSEQTPCDLATIADYSHLTAMLAPRPALLTYNAKDQCCFEAGYALPPLLDAARPIYRLHDKEKNLRAHINTDPGTHNYEKDNRQQFYRQVGDFFFPGRKDYPNDEIDCASELKKKDDLMVDLPKNHDFNTLALELSKSLPRAGELPAGKEQALAWKKARRALLSKIVRARNYDARAEKLESKEGTTQTASWKLLLDKDWTLPVLELTRGKPKGTTILIGDLGRMALAAQAEVLLAGGQRVLAVDLFYFGECKVAEKDFLFALLIAAVGDRPLGVQASQLAAVARWADKQFQDPVSLTAVGPRTSVIALVAAGLEDKLSAVDLHEAPGSLKETIEKNLGVNQQPEQFCFGLLQDFDVKQLVALCGPRPVRFVKPGERARQELAGLNKWYTLLGRDFDPLKDK